MSELTPAVLALLAFATQHHCVPDKLAPLAVGLAWHENHSLNPRAVNHNPNGTVDVGLAQINQVNWGWTGIASNPFDPCKNLAAGVKVFFAKYNGQPPDEVKAAYAAGAMAAVDKVAGDVPPSEDEPPPEEDDPARPMVDALHGGPTVTDPLSPPLEKEKSR